MIVAERCVLAALMVSPVLLQPSRRNGIREVMNDKWASVAVLASASTMPLAACTFRFMTGPQAALAIAVIPALLVVPAHFIVHRPLHRALPAVLASVAFASIAAFSGGLGTPTFAALCAGALFITMDMVSVLAGERARKNCDAMLLIALSMVVGAVVTSALAIVTGATSDFAVSGFVAALVVAVGGTLGRVMRFFALPHIGSVVTSTSNQITAAGTAVGGVLLFNDQLTPVSAGFSLMAAAASVVAATAVVRRRRREEELATPVP